MTLLFHVVDHSRGASELVRSSALAPLEGSDTDYKKLAKTTGWS
jgi:hypothetical protein